ncbi:MAG: 2-C-methyl-D-erythritol 4-phosphate cytidylyltransferase [Bacteroidales bacterium]|nr:2-C-methyl-D-erythritol 4-phosphate cytidylyltransferase [Bacteroidales bacterium]
MRNIAVILAAGSGRRAGMEEPKQFSMLKDRPVVEYALAAFDRHCTIDEICLVCHPDYMKRMEDLRKKGTYRKWSRTIPGGATRRDSTLAALRAYTEDEDNLIFHDAARPLVSQRIIGDVTAALGQWRAVNVCVPSADTLMRTDADGKTIEEVPPRQYWQRSQTPQAFRRSIIAAAYARAAVDDGCLQTDDCSIVKKYLPYEPIFIVRGEPANMKLTYPEDFYYIQYWLS